MRATGLRCEYFVDPLGIDVPAPRLTWMLDSRRRGARQVAYRIEVASNPDRLSAGEADTWDSGEESSDQTANIPYGGRALGSRERCHWRVTAWDDQGRATTSAPASWEMGLLEPRDWKGLWLGHGPSRTPESRGVSHFRREFSTARGVVRARLYVTALGLYTAHLDGVRVGDHELAPGWTDYRKRVHYQVFDVTDALAAGKHALGLSLAEGWYSGHISWLDRGFYGPQPAVIAQLECEYAGGRRDTVATDAGWRGSAGPITSASLLMGEEYDARREMPGWDRVGFDTAKWDKPRLMPRPAAPLEAQSGPPVRAVIELPARRQMPAPGSGQVFDLGQNMVGRVRLKIRGRAGTTIQLRHGEMLNGDGSLMTENLRKARAVDTYTLRGGGTETWEPSFTQHGFRYVEVTGHTGKLPMDTITGVVLQSDTPVTGRFKTSHRLLNKLQHNIEWGQRGNFVHIPTDCPQRDERLGWMGDAQVFAPTACFNADVAAFYSKWLQDVRDAQTESGAFTDVAPTPWEGAGAPAWADAGVIVPWVAYQRYGDRRILEASLASMERWVGYVRRPNPGLLWRKQLNNNYGDWLSVGADTPKEVLATAYFALSARLTGETAGILGHTTRAKRYRALFERIRKAFNTAYVDADGHVEGRTQTCYVVALAFDLLPDAARPKAVRHLVRDIQKHGVHLTTGFVGVSHLLPVLSEGGRDDVAFRLLEQETFPSWLYPVLQGATTIWERWDGYTHEKGLQDPGMNSFNHYAFGSVGDWMYANIGGIAPLEPGYKRVLVAPRPGGSLTSAAAELRSIHGPIRCSWRVRDGRFSLDTAIPANTTAEVRIPTARPDAIREGGRLIAAIGNVPVIGRGRGFVALGIQSGRYRFEAPLSATRAG